MSYSPEVQARINARAAEMRTGGGPSFPMPRLRHNGETGKWMIREIESGDKLAAEEVSFKDIDNNRWSGVIVRVAYLSQTKYKPEASSLKKTREFTDFKNEPIELLKQTFGENGKMETVKTFPNYAAFKEATMLKDDEGNVAGSNFELKVVLYVYHLDRKEVIKFICGGSARTEWFEYSRAKRSGDEGILSTPWRLSQPEAQLLEQVKTTFTSTPAKTDKGAEYHRLSFIASTLCDNKEISEVLDVQEKVSAWAKAWEKANKKPEEPVILNDLQAAGLVNGESTKKDSWINEIDPSSIPF